MVVLADTNNKYKYRKSDFLLLNFPREIGLRRKPCDERSTFDDYVKRINGKASIYTSLYSFERRHPSRSWKFDPDSVVMDRSWWDFDTTEEYDIIQVKKDVATLLSKLKGDVRLVATGRGFHVHEMFDKPVKGVAISSHIIRYENEMGKGLKTLDGVGNPQKLTRVPDTYNVARKKWAVNIDAIKFSQDPLGYKIPVRPDATLLHLDPFRGDEQTSSFSIVKWIAENPKTQATFFHTQTPFEGDIGSLEQVPIPPCLDKAMRHENPKHFVRVALVQHMADSLRWFAPPSSLTVIEKKEIADKIANFIATLGWRDYNVNISRFHIESLMDYNNVTSCAKLQARGKCGGSCWRDDGTRRE